MNIRNAGTLTRVGKHRYVSKGKFVCIQDGSYTDCTPGAYDECRGCDGE